MVRQLGTLHGRGHACMKIGSGLLKEQHAAEQPCKARGPEAGEAKAEPEPEELERDYPMARWGERDGERYFGRLPACTKIVFALPSLGFAAVIYMKQGYMTPFYTDDYPQASLTVIALFRILTVLLDCAWDPLLANWTDSCHSRLGRRRPFLLGACLLCPMAILAAWQPPEASPLATGIWFGLCDMLFNVIGCSMHNIAYNSLGADLTPDFKERTGVWATKELCMVTGILCGSVIPAFVSFGPDCRESPCSGCTMYILVAGVFCIMYVLPQLGLVAQAQERPQPETTSEPSMGICQTIVVCLGNLPFQYLIISDIVEGVGANLPLIVLPYVVRWVIGQEAIEEAGLTVSLMYSALAGIHLLVRIPFTFVWRCAAERFGKVNAYIAFNFLYALNMLAFVLIGEGDIILAMVLSALWGMTYSGHWLLFDIIPSIVDYDEFREGKRREASYYMILELVPKIMEVPTEALPFLLMAYFGYTVTGSEPGEDLDCSLGGGMNGTENGTSIITQPIGVIWTLRASFALVPGIFGLLSAAVLLWFPLRSQAQHDQIMEGIARHRHGEAAIDPFTQRVVPAVAHEADGTRVLGERRLSLESFTQLSHFFTGELQRVVDSGDLACLAHWIEATSIVMACALAGGIGIILWGFPTFVEGHFSITPIGVAVVGLSLALLLFQLTRLRALHRILGGAATLEDARFLLDLRMPPPLPAEEASRAAGGPAEQDAGEQEEEGAPNDDFEPGPTMEASV